MTSARGNAAQHRVHFVGGPGSGKTTLARRLGSRLALPVYDLDTVAYVGGRKQSLMQREGAAARIAGQPRWVTEGIYLGWCEVLAERAAQIVWLDAAWPVAAYRIIRRHVALSLAGTNPHPGLGRLARFAWATRRYYLARQQDVPAPVDPTDDGAITRAMTLVWLRRYAPKVTRCRTEAEVDHFVDGAAHRVRVV